jgi:uncharacterized protein
MADKFLELTLTDSVRAAQQHYYGLTSRMGTSPSNEKLSESEILFIESRDSMYLSTVSETGWPYVQHRGGAPGFLHVISPTQLAFADFRGNRQLLSVGNLSANDRLCLFLMDYPQRIRLKILGRGRVEDARENPEQVAQMATTADRHRVERIFRIDVASFSWNCQQHITPRYTADEIRDALTPLQKRIAEIENQLKETS